MKFDGTDTLHAKPCGISAPGWENILTETQYKRYIESANYCSRTHRSDVIVFGIFIDRDSHRHLLTPYEKGGIHKFDSRASNQ